MIDNLNFNKMKNVILLSLIPFLILSKREPDSYCNYIKLEYGLPTTKPIATVIFYVDSFNKKTLFFGTAYKVDRCEFSKIINEIEHFRNSVKSDTSYFQYYNYTICFNDQIFRYATIDNQTTKGMMNIILKQIDNVDNRKKIENTFSSIWKRLTAEDAYLKNTN